MRRTFSVCPCVPTHTTNMMSFPLSLPAGHSLTWYVCWSWWSFKLPSRLLFQTWYELVCRRSSASFRLSRWKPHFSGTNIGAMFDEKRGRRTRRTPGRTSFPSTSAQVSTLASKQLYLSQIFFFCGRILRLARFKKKRRSVILTALSRSSSSRFVNVFAHE